MLFGSAVLNRPIVEAAVEKHYEKLLDLLDQDLALEFVSINPLFFLTNYTDLVVETVFSAFL